MKPGAAAPLGPAFGNIFAANLASSLGDGIVRTVIPLLAARLTDDAFLISVIAALALLPWLFFAIPAGILIDRFDRRRLLALAQGVRVALAVMLLVFVATDSLTIWWLYLGTFIYGMFETVYDGAIRAVVPSIVPKANLPRANSRIEGGELVVQNFVAGPVTSALFVVSALIPLGINGIVFAIAGGLALALPKAASGRQFAAAAEATTPREPWYRQFADGFRFIFANRMLRILLIVSTSVGVAYSAAMGSFVLFVLDELAVPEAFFGMFLLVGAVGGVLGAVLAQRMKVRFGAGPTMGAMMLIQTASLVFMGLVPQLWAGALGFAISSLAVTTWNILVMSLRQSVIPGRLLGRVHGSWRTVLWGSMPIGSLIGGLIGRVDLALPFLVGGGVAMLIALASFRFFLSLPNPEDVDNGDPVLGEDGAGPTDPTVLD